jgi:hypothetical protein
MRLMLGGLALAAVSALGGEAAPPPTSPVFHRTQDSDEWVAASFMVQGTPARVLVVDGSGARPGTVDVRGLDLNAREAWAGLSATLPVAGVFATLQEAADAARGGDLVAVMPGHYAGFVLGAKDDAGDGRYLHFQAEGKPGQVVIDRPGRDPDWMVLFQTAHHAILEGFNIAGHTGPGLPPAGPRAGIMIDGDFGRSGRLAHHIALVGNFSHNHRKWGFHSTDTHTVLIQDNLFAFSAEEHSGYASDGSDDYVIRRNVFFGSRAGGLQCNIDSVSSFHEVLKHPAFRDFPPERPDRAWAMALVDRATELFGANGFPDGWGVGFIIEDNVINGNGRGGGGSLNLAALSDSLIQNNLIYGNFNHGIAQWDDANPYDAAYVEPGPRLPGDVKGPESLPLWGCHRNVIRNNTVLMANPERAALQFRNGSWGGRARNNLVVNDGGASIEVFGDSVYRLDSGFNVAGEVSYGGMPESLKTLAVSLDESNHSAVGVRRAVVAAQMECDGDEPWVVVEGDWWRLNPARPDFRPRSGSTLLAGRGDPTELPARDLGGLARNAADIGAFAAARAATGTTEAGR